MAKWDDPSLSDGGGVPTVSTGKNIFGLDSDFASSPIFVNTTPVYETSSVYKGGKNGPQTGVTGGNAQYESANAQMQRFAQAYATDPQGQFYNMQQELYLAGMYGNVAPDKVDWTNWSEDDASAMKSALTRYLQVTDSGTPLTFSEFLSQQAKTGKVNGRGTTGGSSGSGSSRPPVQLTDPQTLRQTLQSAAQKALHRDLGEDELTHFVDAFHGQEKQAYNNYYGGQAVTQPDAGAQAVQAVQAGHAPEADQALKAGFNDTLMSMLGGK